MAAQTLFLLASVMVVPGAIGGGPSALSGEGPRRAGDVRSENYPLKAASGENIDAELWRLAVPENRRKPASSVI